MTGYEDVGVSDTDYYSAFKNGKLYLVSKDGKNTSEIGEGAYCYIYSYDEYKELNLLKIDVFSNRGVWKNTYLFDYNGNIAYGYEIRNGKDCNYEVMSDTDGTVILKKGEIQSISGSTNSLNPVKIDGKRGTLFFRKGHLPLFGLLSFGI